ncbi:MAG: Fe-Mn family superoxide dismutase [Chlamydiales bacterium]|jgi:Fe-Mn family superoxide dismutase
MQHILPPIDFSSDSLGPFLSPETLEFHHGKHHRGYVDKLNSLLESTRFEDLSLTEVVKQADGALFNNAAQHFNHSFYWRCITPNGRREPRGEILQAIERDFGSLRELREAFSAAATSHFGSGWCWMVKDSKNQLHIRTSANADCPLVDGEVPLLTCDVWEHAYYIDYRNDRAQYVASFWDAINWNFTGLAFTRPAEIESVILGCLPMP